MSNINFDNPYLLLIAVPLIVLFTIPFVIAVRKDNRNGHNISSMIMHVALAVIIGFAAAGTTVTTVITETQVYVVADVSYSTHNKLEKIDDVIKNKLVLPKNSQVGLITFGKDYELLCGLRKQKDLKSVKTSNVDDSETNIAEALRFAGEQFKRDDVIKRVVLITDGRQTDEVDTSAMRHAVDSLERQNVKVDAYFIDSNLSSQNPEVQISGVEYTQSAFINHEEYVNVTVKANLETRARLVLDKDDEEEYKSQAIELSSGNNIVPFRLYTDEGGTYNYKLHLEDLEADTSDLNNEYAFTQTVSSDLKVLMVTTDWDTCKALVNQYGDSATIDLFEKDVNMKDNWERGLFHKQFAGNDKVNVYSFDENIDSNATEAFGVNLKPVPSTVEALSNYDEIVLADCDLTKMDLYQESFIASLDTVVGSFGKSLVTLGNTYIHTDNGSTTYKKLDNMLPVRFGRNDDAPKSYTIVIDQSISMFDNSRFTVAKQVATALVGTLQDNDYVTVVGFWGENKPIFGPRPMSDAAEVIERINALSFMQGTNVFGGLNTAYEETKNLNFSENQIMLISDGRSMSAAERQQALELVERIYNGGISEDGINSYVTSVFNVGGTTNTNNGSMSDNQYDQFLKSIAEKGHGNYFERDAKDENLSDGMFAEISKMEGKKEFEQDADVLVNRITDDVLSAPNVLPTAGLPKISGYIASVAKPSATTVLQLVHDKGNGKTSNMPLYAYWTYGAGRVSSFTSSFTDGVTFWHDRELEDQSLFDQSFFDNVMYVNIPKQKTDYPYAFSVTQQGIFTQVRLTPPESALHFNARATIRLKMPDDSVVNQTMILDGKYYYYNFNSSQVGRYEIEVTYNYGGTNYKTASVLNVSYANEYDEFLAYEASPLFRAINGRGQVITDDSSLKLENKASEMGVYTQDFTFPLLIIAVVLFVVDIVVRKLKWEDIISFFGGFKKSGGKKK